MEENMKPLLPANGPRPHRCEVCQRSFREIATLRKHEQLHRADRPYVCNTCGKSFLWSSNLKVHERVHTGERPYKCKICHRCFTQSNDLRRHERNVHMRGKIYGYKSSGRHNSQVNLAAYQAFAMQQRALLQQALTYESYLQKAAVGGSQPSQLFRHTQGMGGAGTAPMVGPRPPESVCSPRSPLKLEQVTPPSTPSDMNGGLNDKRLHNLGSPHHHEPLLSPARVGGLASMPLVSVAVGVIQSPPALIPGHYSAIAKNDAADLPHSQAGTLPSFSSFRSSQRSLDGLQTMALGSRFLPPGHRPHPHLSDNRSLPHANLRLTQEMISFHHQQHIITGSDEVVTNGPVSSRRMPPQLSPQGLIDRDKNMEQQGQLTRVLDQRYPCREDNSGDFDSERQNESKIKAQNGSGGQYSLNHNSPVEQQKEIRLYSQNHNSPVEQQKEVQSYSQNHNSPVELQREVRPYIQNHSSPVEKQREGLQENISINYPSQHTLRQPLTSQDRTAFLTSSRPTDDECPKSYPCDSVMDLSMNKTSSTSPPSRTSSSASSTNVDKEVGAVTMPPPKTPASIGAESESEPGKRDVTTTSATPVADSGGIHHCQHCNIFFYDYTMFHLHESLHMPYEEHPFRCPSCGTHCQDKIEFMFHTVWHVKYPHTIPNYTPFREGLLSSP